MMIFELFGIFLFNFDFLRFHFVCLQNNKKNWIKLTGDWEKGFWWWKTVYTSRRHSTSHSYVPSRIGNSIRTSFLSINILLHILFTEPVLNIPFTISHLFLTVSFVCSNYLRLFEHLRVQSIIIAREWDVIIVVRQRIDSIAYGLNYIYFNLCFNYLYEGILSSRVGSYCHHWPWVSVPTKCSWWVSETRRIKNQLSFAILSFRKQQQQTHNYG